VLAEEAMKSADGTSDVREVVVRALFTV